jgi:O-antigen/teichoic acid export membrane protein
MSFRTAAIIGATWSAYASIVGILVQFVQLIVLARLLEPSDFGLMAIVAAVLAFAQMYLDVGVGYVIVQRQYIDPDHLSSLYWLNIVVGTLLFLLVTIATPALAAAFHQPRLYSLFPAVASLFFIGSFGLQFQFLLQKTLCFKELALVDIAASLGSAIAAIIAAHENLGVYSLVIGQVVATIISTTAYVSIGLSRWRPQFRFRHSDFKAYFSFGLYQLAERTLNLMSSRVDQLLIGAALGSDSLGYYSFAWSLIIQPVNRINPILTRVALPILSAMQDDKPRSRRAYLQLLRILSSVNAPLFAGLVVVAPTLIPLVYGDKWSSAIPLIQILAGVGFLRAITNPMGILLLSRGRADLGFVWTLGIALIHIPIIFTTLVNFGLLGMTIAVLLLHIFYALMHYPFVVRRFLGNCAKDWVQSFGIPVIVAAFMGLLVWLIPSYPRESLLALLSVQIIAGVVGYSTAMAIVQPSLFSHARKFVSSASS